MTSKISTYHGNARCPAPKPIHRAKLISQAGNISPFCAETPRKLNLAKESWTNRDDAVTCRKCLSKLKAGDETKGRSNK